MGWDRGVRGKRYSLEITAFGSNMPATRPTGTIVWKYVTCMLYGLSEWRLLAFTPVMTF